MIFIQLNPIKQNLEPHLTGITLVTLLIERVLIKVEYKFILLGKNNPKRIMSFIISPTILVLHKKVELYLMISQIKMDLTLLKSLNSSTMILKSSLMITLFWKIFIMLHTMMKETDLKSKWKVLKTEYFLLVPNKMTWKF